MRSNWLSSASACWVSAHSALRALVGDDLLGHLGQRAVAQDHQMQVEKALELRRGVLRDVVGPARPARCGPWRSRCRSAPARLRLASAQCRSAATSSRVWVSRCARPMAMPPETPMPWMVKDIGARLEARGARTRDAEARAALERLRVLSCLAPRASRLTRFLQTSPRSTGRCRSSPLPRPAPLVSMRDPRALGGGEHHHAHDALCVHPPSVARKPYLALMLAGELGELGRRPRVQAQLVDDLNFPLLHCPDSPAACASRPRRRPKRPCHHHSSGSLR